MDRLVSCKRVQVSPQAVEEKESEAETAQRVRAPVAFNYTMEQKANCSPLVRTSYPLARQIENMSVQGVEVITKRVTAAARRYDPTVLCMLSVYKITACLTSAIRRSEVTLFV
ncbi:hypothetical protein J6590_097951 [Homalodisca vitripennis]|nr:hypothetical protein J6590_009802 [Homalodisca vitripennis]KAG8334072.1 hypothetical protein J6590_097951 [Homalodisca vitripennis]